jgi:hypothetical protein
MICTVRSSSDPANHRQLLTVTKRTDTRHRHQSLGHCHLLPITSKSSHLYSIPITLLLYFACHRYKRCSHKIHCARSPAGSHLPTVRVNVFASRTQCRPKALGPGSRVDQSLPLRQSCIPHCSRHRPTISPRIPSTSTHSLTSLPSGLPDISTSISWLVRSRRICGRTTPRSWGWSDTCLPRRKKSPRENSWSTEMRTERWYRCSSASCTSE